MLLPKGLEPNSQTEAIFASDPVVLILALKKKSLSTKFLVSWVLLLHTFNPLAPGNK